MSVVQLPMHSKLMLLHVGVAVGQSPLPMQSTHLWSAGWHRGLSDGHDASATHSTHCFVTGSQAGRSGFVQSVLVEHPMH